jgi:hypothetical protein
MGSISVLSLESSNQCLADQAQALGGRGVALGLVLSVHAEPVNIGHQADGRHGNAGWERLTQAAACNGVGQLPLRVPADVTTHDSKEKAATASPRSPPSRLQAAWQLPRCQVAFSSSFGSSRFGRRVNGSSASRSPWSVRAPKPRSCRSRPRHLIDGVAGMVRPGCLPSWERLWRARGRADSNIWRLDQFTTSRCPDKWTRPHSWIPTQITSCGVTSLDGSSGPAPPDVAGLPPLPQRCPDAKARASEGTGSRRRQQRNQTTYSPSRSSIIRAPLLTCKRMIIYQNAYTLVKR